MVHSIAAAPVTECIKQKPIEWTKDTDDSFKLLKRTLAEALILALADFDKAFELDCNA